MKIRIGYPAGLLAVNVMGLMGTYKIQFALGYVEDTVISDV
jgi:hypothetical protein